MERKELCIISDSDIPSGSGGINGEGYTYGQLHHQPIITRVRDKKRLVKVGNLVKILYLYR